MNYKYDYLIVGAGLFGAICAHELNKLGKKVLVIDKRNHIGGNIYTENIEGITIHRYGAHIFHTNKKWVWDYINQFAKFNNYTHKVIAINRGKSYNLPFNMNTFKMIWPNIKTTKDVKNIIEKDRGAYSKCICKNLEDQAIKLVGKTIYKILIKEYTEKQWGKSCNKLSPSIINRIPIKYSYNNNYFIDSYQGIPIGGYTQIIEKMLHGIDLKLNSNYLNNRKYYKNLSNKIIYTGPIDEFFNYCYGPLEYRSLKFETKILNKINYQSNSVINYVDSSIPYTRIIEHKYFEQNIINNKTVITKEYPIDWKVGVDPFYPINDSKNSILYKKYKQQSLNENIIFGGRLGDYKYYDMDDTIIAAINLINNLYK